LYAEIMLAGASHFQQSWFAIEGAFWFCFQGFFWQQRQDVSRKRWSDETANSGGSCLHNGCSIVLWAWQDSGIFRN
jgi:hypothetical protein